MFLNIFFFFFNISHFLDTIFKIPLPLVSYSSINAPWVSELVIKKSKLILFFISYALHILSDVINFSV